MRVKISEILYGIDVGEIVLPEFQREYVWNREQSKQLIFSLLRGYPVGGLLFWKTPTPPDLKSTRKATKRSGTYQVLLDGQQRVTTLYMLIRGDIPPFYSSDEIKQDPRDLYYNLRDGELQYFSSSKMDADPFWQSVTDCFDSQAVSIFKVLDSSEVPAEDREDVGRAVEGHLNSLRAIRDLELPTQTVPATAQLAEAVDVFDRVNSQGTKLRDWELALTHMTASWPEVRRQMKTKIAETTAAGFDFDLKLMTRALTTVVAKRPDFSSARGKSADDLSQAWVELKSIVDYLVRLLPERACIHSTSEISSPNAVIPIIAYLSLNGGRFKDEVSLGQAMRWLFTALLWSHYSGQTETKLEADVGAVTREERPWQSLLEHIEDHRGRLTVKAADFDGKTGQSPLYKGSFILAKARGAHDWFNGLPLRHSARPFGIHSHHVFPYSVLKDAGWDRKHINAIGNRVFITGETNQSVGTKLPSEYLPIVIESYPGALELQCVPTDPALWKLDRYEDFLQARADLLAVAMNEHMEALGSGDELEDHRSAAELVGMPESYTLEFKSSLQWDMRKKDKNAGLRESVLKTVAAFLNSGGGTLIIGVEDDGTVCGLDGDLRLQAGSIDRFENLLATLISQKIGARVSPLYTMRFDEVEGRQVCILDVKRSSKPVYLETSKGKQFFVRSSNSTRALDVEEARDYEIQNWD